MALKLGSTGSALRVGSTTAKYARVGTTLKAVAPPLDIAGSAAAAYSLRKLSYAYTGPVVEVRRSSDDTTADFTADEVEDGTLAAWVGAGNDGFVATWYDQSGNSRDATQATAGSQPQIVDNGSVVTEGGKPAIEFDGVDDHLVPSSNIEGTVWDGDFSLFSLLSITDFNNYNYLYSGWGTRDVVFAGFTAESLRLVIYDGSGQTTFSGELISDTQHFFGWIRKKASGTFSQTDFKDSESTAYTGNAVARSNTDAIGARYASNRAETSAKMQELLIYPSDQTANRTAIEGNAAWHYGLQNKLPYNHAEVRPQTLPTDNDVLAFAAASGAVSIPDLLKIEDLVAYLKAQSLWDYARFYPMKSAQNAGSGSTVYGLGGLTSNNMTLVNSPTWGSDGVTFASASSQYGNIGPLTGGLDFFVSLGIKRSVAPPAGNEAMFGQYTTASNERAFIFNHRGDIAGDPFTTVRSADGITVETTLTSSETQTTDAQVVTAVCQDGAEAFIYQNKTALSTSVTGEEKSIFNTANDYYVAAFNSSNSPSQLFSGSMFSLLVIVGDGVSPTTTQRETITDLINAL